MRISSPRLKPPASINSPSAIGTCAGLCHLAASELDEIQFLLGHVSIQTTERYHACKQKLRVAVNDRLGIKPLPSNPVRLDRAIARADASSALGDFSGCNTGGACITTAYTVGDVRLTYSLLLQDIDSSRDTTAFRQP